MLPTSSQTASAVSLLLVLAAALAGPPVVVAAAPTTAVKPSETTLAGMETRLEKAITAKLEEQMGADLAEHQTKIASLETQLAWHARRLDALAAKDEKQQAQLERYARSNSTEPPLQTHTTRFKLTARP